MNAVKMLFVSQEMYSGFRKADKALANEFYNEICHKSGDSKHKSFKVGFPKNVAGWYVIDDKAGQTFMKKWAETIENTQVTEDPTPTEIVPKTAKKAVAAPTEAESLTSLIQAYNDLAKKAKKTAMDKKLIDIIEKKIENF